MSLCATCVHSEILQTSSRQYRMCNKLTPNGNSKKHRDSWMMCMNARIDGQCGPSGKLWEANGKEKKDKK